MGDRKGFSELTMAVFVHPDICVWSSFQQGELLTLFSLDTRIDTGRPEQRGDGGDLREAVYLLQALSGGGFSLTLLLEEAKKVS